MEKPTKVTSSREMKAKLKRSRQMIDQRHYSYRRHLNLTKYLKNTLESSRWRAWCNHIQSAKIPHKKTSENVQGSNLKIFTQSPQRVKM